MDKSNENIKENMLHLAVTSKHDKCLNALLKAGVDVNWGDEYYRVTALMKATNSGYVYAIQSLLEAGADANLKIGFDTLATSAVSLAEYGLDILDTSDLPFMQDTDILLSLSAAARLTINDRDHSTPLINVMIMKTEGESRAVASDKRKKCIELLLKAGADVNGEGRENMRGITALSIACRNGLDEEVEYLLKAGADVNMVPHNGITALMEASRKDNADIPITHYIRSLEVLIQAGADVNMTTHGPAALLIASHNRFDEGVELLIKAGADLNTQCHLRALTPFIMAAKKCNTICAELLIEAGTNVNLQNPDGSTALMFAAG